MSIEGFNAGRDPYRCSSTNHVAMPWPFDDVLPSKEARDSYDTVEAECNKVLESRKIVCTDIRIGRLVPKSSYQARDTLIVSVEGKPSEDPNILRAADDLYAILRDEYFRRGSTSNVAVEIRNPAMMSRVDSAYVPDNSPAIAIYTKIKPDIDIYVQENIPRAVKVALSMRAQRGNATHAHATVVITILPHTAAWWDTQHKNFGNHLQGLLARSGVNSSNVTIGFEFLSGSIQLGVSAECEPLKGKEIVNLPERPLPGSSIGPRDLPAAAGSMGPFIWVQPPGCPTKLPCVVTCWHVVEGGVNDDVKQIWFNENGFRLGADKKDHKIIIDYPGGLDADVLEKLHKTYSPDSKSKKKSDNTMQIIEHWKTHGVGAVLYGSGLRRKNSKGRRMDWCVIELFDKDNFRRNPCTAKTQSLVEDLVGQDMLVNKTYTLDCDDFVDFVDDISDTYKGQPVVKTSRTSGCNVGFVNRPAVSVKWPGDDKWSTNELEVKPGINGGHTFARNGDSGKSQSAL